MTDFEHSINFTYLSSLLLAETGKERHLVGGKVEPRFLDLCRA